MSLSLCRTTQVPVGQDQAQHIEFTRDCAKTFNSTYGQVFAKPQSIICKSCFEKRGCDHDCMLDSDLVTGPAKRIMSLKQPLLKMSKSDKDSNSRIHLTDSTEVISKKVRLALTDSIPGVSYDPFARPGLSNLLAIISHLNGRESPEGLAQRHKSLKLLELKELVTTTVSDHLRDFRQRYFELMKDENVGYLEQIAATGAKKARGQADVILQMARRVIGLV